MNPKNGKTQFVNESKTSLYDFPVDNNPNPNIRMDNNNQMS